MGTILLYYRYVDVADPIALKESQEAFCKKVGLTGRILVATEGINGTLGGSDEAAAEYVAWMKTQPLFADMPFKTSPGDQSCFPKLSVKVKKEIVNLGIAPEALSYKDAGTHLTPQEFHAALAAADENTVIIDGRNAYEARVGKFTGAVVPPVNRFREFPAYIDQQAEELKDKTVLMYCTGGVRCERASAYLKQKGIDKVYQLKGGIHEYLNEYPDGYFRGINYVFDSRLSLKTNDDVLGTCDHCGTSCEEYTNCLNASCNKHFIGCPTCVMSFENTCSATCRDLLRSGAVKARPPLRKYTCAQ
jgi:predicted sulfurtransferase